MENEDRIQVRLRSIGDWPLEDFVSQLKNAPFVESIKFEAQKQPPNTSKGGVVPLDWTSLIVTVAASGGILTTLINLVQAHLTKDRTITLEIGGDKLVITGVSPHEQADLIAEWLQRQEKRMKDYHHATKKRSKRSPLKPPQKKS